MNFNQMVMRNTLRNKHLYLAYFLSTLFSVMVFFTFTVFAFHPSLTNGLNKNVQMGMLAAAIIIYGFAFFFVLYSMDVFIQSRKKEFGVLMIQGMSPHQLRKMIFIENLVIGFSATVAGSVAGIGFSQFILWFANVFIHVKFYFYFPVMAFLVTMISFLLLFLLISFFIQFRLPKLQLQELLKAGELGKGRLKLSLIKAVLAILLIGGGYAVALATPGVAVVFVMLPVIFVVIIGTKFLFEQLSVSIIQWLKGRQHLFWKKTNLVVFSDLAFRMKDNSRSFFLVAIISTVAFAAIGTLYGVQNLLLQSYESEPYEFQVIAEPEKLSAIQTQINDQLRDNHIKNRSVMVKTYYDNEGKQFLKVSEFNQLAGLLKEGSLHLSQGDAAVQLENDTQFGNAAVKSKKVTVGTQTYTIEKLRTTKALSAYTAVYVLPDSADVSQLTVKSFAAWITPDAKRAELIAAGKKVRTGTHSVVMGKTLMEQTTIDGYAPILFVGIFIGIVFFFSAGSFLYFRLYSDIDVDVEKFRMIYQLGLSKKELRKMIYQQVAILFFTPIAVSVIHGAVALTAMYHIFQMNMQLAGWEVLGVFVVIQAVYYLIARNFYFRKVYHLIQVAA